MSTEKWNKFMSFAAIFANTVDLDAEEYNYKVALAERLKKTREAYIAGDPEWFEMLRKDISSSNLMNQYFMMRLVDLGRTQPDDLRKIIGLLWIGEPDVEKIDDFTEQLRPYNPEQFSVGGIVGFASILLLARDPHCYPPYRARMVKKFLKLVSWEDRGANGMPAERYQLLLDALDEMLRLAREHDVTLRDRLDAQGLLWTVMNVDPSEDWSSEQSASLRQWRGDKKPTVEVDLNVPAGQRAWLVRQSQAGTAMLQPWLEDGFVSTPAQHLGSPTPGSTLNQIQTAVNKGYQHIEYSERKLRATEYHRFLSVMKVDDYVLTAFEDTLYLGVVTGEARYVDDASSRLRRAVAWQKTSISNTDVPAPLPRLLAEQGSVVDLTEALSIITAWYGDNTDVNDVTEDAAPTPQIAVVPQLRKATPELARKLNVSQKHLQEVIRLLQTRQQFVFYGPPGTGKTYLGKAIAKFLAGEEHTDHVKMVQFHPSYAYEDFFEGYRPAKSQDGTVGFSLEAGPLRRIADEAASEGNRDKPYFLIIDEMNRGNLAKIFGELYYLLEYRSEGINLQYNPEKVFALPPNLFIIGTMNTSDRSIAMVDAAIRRRFAFVELHPQEGMIAGLLERFLEANGKPSLRADLLKALNNEIEDTNRDLMIGPSYFMKPHAETDEGLEEIWKYELLPLLEEQYFGRLKRAQVREKFGLAAMRLKASALIGPVDLSLASGEPALDAEGTEELEQPLTDSEDTST